MKLGLCSWSYNRTFDSGKLNLEKLLKVCADELKIGGIDIISVHLASTDKKYLLKIKKMATDLNITLACLSPSSSFGQPDEKGRQEQIEDVRKWLDIGIILGAPVLRIFAGWPWPKEDGKKLWPYMIECMKKSAKYAEEAGITLAVEPHNDGGFLPSSVETFKLLKEVASDYVKLNLDTGNYQDKDNYAAIDKSMPYAVHMHAKIHKLSPDGRELEFDYDKIFQILKKHNYRGFFAVEYEGKEEEMEYVPKSFEMIRQFMKKYEIYS